MTKTVILTGAELRVEGLEGQNVIVQNLGTNTIYASINPNITPDADNVIEIPAGGGVNVYGANGTIYLMGTGRAQCTGTDYSTVNFKMPSSSVSGGGGNTSYPSVPTEPIAKMLPHTNGLQGVYDWEDVDEANGVWNSQIDGEAQLELFGDYSKMDDCFRFDSTGFGKAYMENPSHTIYAIMKAADPYFINTHYPQFISEVSSFGYNNRLCMCMVPRNSDNSCGVDNGLRISIGAWGRPNYCPNAYADRYIVYCITRDENFNLSIYTDSGFDFSFITGTESPIYAGGYNGITLLNSESSNGVTFNPENASIATDWKFFAIGDGVQTPEQIRENIAWLAQKYLGQTIASTAGSVSEVETMPTMDGITNWFDVDSRLSDLAGSQLDFKYEDDSIYFQPNASGALIYSEEMPVTVYMVFKRNRISGSGTIIDRSVNNTYNYGLGVTCDNNNIYVHSCNADGCSGLAASDSYHVVAVTNYNMENGKTKQQLYIDGELVDTNENNYAASDYAKDRYGGFMAINGIARPSFSHDSAMELWFKYFAMGSVAHTEDQIKQNSAWLMSKYGIGGG